MSLDEATLVADVRSRLFAPSGETRTIGAELELIPIVAATKAPTPIIDPDGPSLATVVGRAASAGGWEESRPAGKVPSWNVPGGSRISFEPGGQIEISSAPSDSCSALIASLQRTARLLAAAAGDEITLLFVGADPYNDASATRLQLDSDRYVRMDRYLEARGEFGIRMMRQSAALQISVEHGPRPLERWALLNAVAPYLVAVFANSPRYAGEDTGHASYRAHFWRELDGTRTGIPFDALDPARRYADFALDAGALRAENGTGEFHSFRSLLDEPSLTIDDWHFHLSTLFPEVRPKEYFEIRSPDTMDPEYLAAPLAFVAGIVYDDVASAAALDLLARPDGIDLRAAGLDGLHDPRIQGRAAELVRISMDGADRLPNDYLTADDRRIAAMWLDDRVRK